MEKIIKASFYMSFKIFLQSPVTTHFNLGESITATVRQQQLLSRSIIPQHPTVGFLITCACLYGLWWTDIRESCSGVFYHMFASAKGKIMTIYFQHPPET